METLEEVEGTPATPALTCASPPVAIGTWTDHLGNVHERLTWTPSRTRCGHTAGVQDDGKPFRGCRECVRASLRAFVLTHDCSREGCVEL